jgi:hypothetical protein
MTPSRPTLLESQENQTLPPPYSALTRFLTFRLTFHIYSKGLPCMVCMNKVGRVSQKQTLPLQKAGSRVGSGQGMQYPRPTLTILLSTYLRWRVNQMVG